MFSTPLICCSRGVATVRDTVSADAPGYTVVICTVGGTISGYCATGRTASAPSPSNVTKALSTVAKRGRSIKKCVRRMVWLSLVLPTGRTDRAILSGYFGSRRDVRQSFHNDSVARCEPGSDHSQTVANLSYFHSLCRDCPVRRDRHDHVLRLVRQHGSVRHKERR